MNRKWLVLVIALLVAGGGAAFWWQDTFTSPMPEGIRSSNGRIEAERIEIATKLAGRIAEVLLDEGDWVEAGDVIARMDTDELEAQLHQAQASVLQAQQQRLQAEALLRQRKSELVTAEAEFKRVSQLAKDGFFSDAQADAQRTVLDTAQAAVAAAEAGISLADATIASADAAVDRLEALIRDAALTAPRPGRVQYVLAQEGEVLGAGGRVATLTDLSDMYMSIFLPTADAARLAIGDEARIILDALPEYVIPATVTFVASTAQFTPRSVETADEREQLMFRVNLTISPELLADYLDRARAGVPGMGYVRLDKSIEWPANLVVRLPE
ncbi:HlyD family efflux transporter periplasmic adaptor subunit [Aliishimia ponticola]|uniref:HlyD family efflux transporter periplasmic adaptor subunit n=1 Tax=Aliishimia ponticola TaxID=2499833 RepID=A0A4S4NC17_9RHOB|nr:HlyD family efflux transporter periplasmic adaptor subunit [Aliishimia ponticola]THH36899.1 HlyD family efflux transporter periplasmic adaptor subunit [Aliishimia ponticola]